MKEGVRRYLDDLFTRRPEIEACEGSIIETFETMAESLKNGGKILCCGNGGSASDSLHFVGEMLKSFFNRRILPDSEKKKFTDVHEDLGGYVSENLQMPLRAIDLVSSSAISTAILNDNAADMIFAQSLYGLGLKGDVLLGISTSGNSGNVINAIVTAKAMGIKTVALTGKSGGKMKELCDTTIIAPGINTPIIQEAHLPIYHALCLMLEEEFYGKADLAH